MRIKLIDIVDFYSTFPQFVGKVEVLTRFGFKKIEAAKITEKKSDCHKIITTCGKVVICSPEHKWLTTDCKWEFSKNLKVGGYLYTPTNPTKIKKIIQLKGKRDLYDLQVEAVHEFFANDLVSHNSSIVESICFALYGKAYRNINKGLLINSINLKQCLVEILFSIGSKNYKVIRGIKPGIFEIWEDGNLINQDPSIKDYQKVLEQQILQMNYRAFTQVVVMGSGEYTPFMKLKPQERREFIEDLLDIRVFSIMNSILKEKVKTAKEQIKDVESGIRILKEKITLQDSFVEKQKKDNAANLGMIEEEIRVVSEENIVIQKNVDELMLKVAGLKLDGEKYSNAYDVLSELQLSHRNTKRMIAKYDEEKTQFHSLDECPQCKQSITADHKTHIVNKVEKDIAVHEKELLSMNDAISEAQKNLKKWEDLLEKTNTLNGEISSLNRTLSINNALIKSKQQSIDKVKSDTSNLDDSKRILKEFARSILAHEKNRQQLIETMHYYTASGLLLQDSGIKSKIIKQYVPVINKLVNKYLDELELFVSFNINENFEEEIKSRHRDMFKYDSFSEGQKARVDFAFLMAWRQIAVMKNSVNCNILFLDEIGDGSMELDGVALSMDILKSLKETNVFIISHKDGINEKFDNIIEVSLKNNFTTIQ